MAMACWPDLDRARVTDRRGRESGRVDLDDGEIGERVDAVDGGVERAPVLEVDGELGGVAADDVMVRQDEPVRVEDDAGARTAVPVPVWPVVGSVSVTPSAMIVTTAGLTALTMSTTDAWPPQGATGAAVAAGACEPGPAAVGAGVGRAPGPAAVGATPEPARRGIAETGRVHREVGPAGREDGRREDGGHDEARAGRATGGGRLRGRSGGFRQRERGLAPRGGLPRFCWREGRGCGRGSERRRHERRWREGRGGRRGRERRDGRWSATGRG